MLCIELQRIKSQFCIGKVFLDIRFHLRHSNRVVGMDVNMLYSAPALYHKFQHIQARFSTGKIIVQADEIDILEDTDQ